MSTEYKLFGKYILLEKVASGGMAEIYLAKSSGADGIGKFFAIKRILPQFSDNQDFIDMFKDEAKISVNLNHGNVVPIFEFGLEEGRLYLVMEFIEGRNLRQILNFMKKNTETFSIQQIVFICKEVSKGLDHAHRCLDGTTGKPLNIIHRDMSPQNIILSFEGELKIIDFGIAKAESKLENTRTGTLKGKFGYMSPEQAEGLPIDSRTDIFSLGIIMWELFANDRLFISNNEVNTLRKIRDCQIPSLRKINPNIPPELERIVNKTLAKDRNLRYQTCAALSKDLNRFLNTHFPDFSVQDFSAFIKNMYSDSIKQNRDKMVSFSKIKMSEFSPKETNNTEFTSTLTDASPLVKELPDNFLGNSQINVNLTALKKSDKEQEFLSKVAISRGSYNSKTSNTSISKVNEKKGPEDTHVKVAPYGRADNIQTPLLIGLGTVAIAALAFFLWPQKNQSSITNKHQKLEQASIEKIDKTFALVVRTDPPGAQIFINGKATSIITPGKVRYKANQPFTISIMKSGYATYERRVSLNNNKSLRAPLLVLNQGYIDINVLNARPKTSIYINGKQISDPLPIKNYPVPANKSLVIKAENHFSRTSDEKKIQIKPSTRASINLLLRRQHYLKRKQQISKRKSKQQKRWLSNTNKKTK